MTAFAEVSPDEPFRHTGTAPRRSSARPSAARLAAAIARGDIRTEFQPKVSLLTGDLIGVEALARWTDHELGPVPPDVFIPVAERNGLIGRLTIGVLRQSLETCARLRRSHPNATVAVNISPILLSDPALAQDIANMLDETSVAPNALVAEITESAAVTGGGPGFATLTRLRDTGVGCSIDDFGTGYASLLSLLRMPFTELKIDRAFTAACNSSPDAWKIVRATIRLAQELRLRVVAEGIETEAIAETLRDCGCEFGQGFRYGQSMPDAVLIGAALGSQRFDGRAFPPVA